MAGEAQITDVFEVSVPGVESKLANLQNTALASSKLPETTTFVPPAAGPTLGFTEVRTSSSSTRYVNEELFQIDPGSTRTTSYGPGANAGAEQLTRVEEKMRIGSFGVSMVFKSEP